MGNFFTNFRRNRKNSLRRSGGGSRGVTDIEIRRAPSGSTIPEYPFSPPTSFPAPSFQKPSSFKTSTSLPKTSSTTDKQKPSTKSKYAFIPDNYSTVDQVTAALRESGLESSNLIIGIDFTKSNEWTGKVSFNNRSLHAIGSTPNPYEKAISIIGKTLAPFDEDNLIPCFGFGDATTHDQGVFSFHSDHSPCHGFEEVLACYKKIVPNLQLSGPTSYGPVVEAAIDIVERTGGQYHVLVIIADGQVTRSVDTGDGKLSPQEEKTINSIVNASSYPLSIVLVGVGDGPWEDMKNFDDKIPARQFDNFQFVNFTAIMDKNATPSEKEASFALAALMEIPIQYKATIELDILGHTTGKAKKIVPRPPPVSYAHRAPSSREPSNISAPMASREPSNISAPMVDERNQVDEQNHGLAWFGTIVINSFNTEMRMLAWESCLSSSIVRLTQMVHISITPEITLLDGDQLDWPHS